MLHLFDTISYRRFLLLAVLAVGMILCAGLLRTSGTAAAATCYQLADAGTIHYYDRFSCSEVTTNTTPTETYEKGSGDVFKGPPVRSGTGVGQAICNPSTNEITLGKAAKSGSLKRTKTSAVGIGGTCLNVETTSISVNGWNGGDQPPGGDGSTPGAGDGEEGEETSSCKVDGVGWLVCPTMNFIAGITDESYKIVKAMLETSPSMFDRSQPAGQATYQVWGIMRNIANVAFVIAFMVIIYSQLTSIGISNYGVKKMLPRLIIAAILVNLSFFICAAAVDISNVIGHSIKGSIDSVTNGINITSGDTGWDSAWNGNDPPQWSGLVTFILAGGILIYAGLSVLLPIGIAALAAIVTVVVVLTLRQALILLLVVVAPLAFVAFLLPNTEGWFKKWRGLFATLLLMFPAIALIFGASTLAGKIVMGGADGPPLIKTAIQIMGAGITIIPLFITPVIMKTAGGVLNRFAGMVNNSEKGVFDRMKRSADGYRGYRKNVNQSNRLGRSRKVLSGSGGALGEENSRRRKIAAFIAGSGSTRSVDQAQRRRYAEESAKETAQEYFANRALEDPNFAKNIVKDEKQVRSLQASAQAAVDKMETEAVGNREVLLRAKIDPRNLDEVGKELEKAIGGNDVATARAAQRILLGSGSKGIAKLSNTLAANEGSLSEDTSKALRKDINGAGLKGKDNALASWAYMDKRLGDLISSADTYSNLNPTELAGQNIDNLKAAPKGAISAKMAQAVLDNQQASQLLDKHKRELFEKLAKASGTTLSVPHSSSPQTTAPSPTVASQPQTTQSQQPASMPTQQQITPQQPAASSTPTPTTPQPTPSPGAPSTTSRATPPTPKDIRDRSGR